MPKPHEDIAILRLSRVSGVRLMGCLAGVFVVVDVGDVVKLRCTADLMGKTVHERNGADMRPLCLCHNAIASFTIPFRPACQWHNTKNSFFVGAKPCKT